MAVERPAGTGQKLTLRSEARGTSMSEQDGIRDNASEHMVVVGGPVDELSASLAVYGEDLEPGDVTNLLGIEPTFSFRRGYRRRPTSVPAPRGGWFLKMRAVDHPDPGALIGTLLSKLPADREIWGQLNARFKVQLRVAIHMQGWNKGFGIDPASVARLATTGAEVVFDVYAYGDNDQEDE